MVAGFDEKEGTDPPWSREELYSVTGGKSSNDIRYAARLTLAKECSIRRIQRRWRCEGGGEVRVVIQVPQDIHSSVQLAWTGEVRWVQVVDAEVKVASIIVIVINGGEVIEVESWDSAEGHLHRCLLKEW